MIQLQDLQSTFNLDVKPLKAAAGLAVAGVTAIAAGIGIAMKATMDWALEVDSLGDVMDGTTDQMAAMAFTARKSGVGVDKLAKAGVMLNKNLLKVNGTLDTGGEILKQYGIAVKDANGNVKTSVQLTQEIADKYASLSTAQERVNFLTEVYGKSGADMVDFFDTLVADGGIDKVTEKVKALGLAIDPARYEQFNRNLEELKLIGLGLAVQLTEKIMPAVEKFLGLLTDPNLTSAEKLSKIFTAADKIVATFVDGLANEINQWVSNGGPEELSKKLIDWIENFGTDETTKTKTQAAVGRLVQAIADAFGEVDWDGVKTAIGDKVEEAFDANRPRGQNAVFDFFDALEVAGTNKVRDFFNNIEVSVTNWIRGNFRNILFQGALGGANAMSLGFLGGLPSFLANLQTLRTQTDEKLREIAKDFFNRALGWANQMAQGFENGKGALLRVLEGLVEAINGVLRRIITSFTINIRLPSWMGGGGGGGGGSTGSGSGSSNDYRDDGPGESGRATGGPVVAGRSYNVAEFSRPEVFTPNTSGRIDPVRNQPVIAKISDDDLNRLARMIGTETVKAMNNA